MSTAEHKGTEITDPSLANTQGIPHSDGAAGIATAAASLQKKLKEIFSEKSVMHVKVKYDIFLQQQKKTVESVCVK